MTATALLSDILVQLIDEKAADADPLEVLAGALTNAGIDVDSLIPENQQVLRELINRLLTVNP